jgi:hypothetical protein
MDSRRWVGFPAFLSRNRTSNRGKRTTRTGNREATLLDISCNTSDFDTLMCIQSQYSPGHSARQWDLGFLGHSGLELSSSLLVALAFSACPLDKITMLD